MRDDKPYYELRKEMYAKGVTHHEIAAELKKSTGYVSERMTAKNGNPFTISDAYSIMEMLELPVEQMHKYFPDYRRRDAV